MDEDDDALGVGFEIQFRDSFGELKRLDEMVGASAENMFRLMQSMEKSLGMPIAKFEELARAGASYTRSQRELTRERNQAEKAGYSLARQMERDIANFGKSRVEIERNKRETAALRLEQAGLTVQAAELRQQIAQLDAMHAASAAAATEQAQAIRSAAFAYDMFEARARDGVAAMRQREQAARAAAAAEADLATRAQRLVEGINPAAAAQNRFNAEMAEARLLISAGAISLDDYVLKLRAEQGALDTASVALGRGAASAGAHRQAMAGASYQVQDFLTQVSMGANPINAFAVQGAQLAGQFSTIEGKAGAVARFFMGPWGIAITGALLVVGMLTKGLFEAGDAADKGKNKFIDLSDATARQKASTEELMKAIDDYNKSQEKQNDTTRYGIKLALDLATAKIKVALATREALAAQLMEQQNREDYLQRNMGGNVDTSLSQGVANQIAKNAESIKTLQLEIGNRTIELGKIAAQALDPLEAVKLKYDDIAAAAERAARASGDGRAYGAPIGGVLVEIERRRRAEEELVRERNKPAARGTAAADARVGDMVALIKQLFPAAQITSTTGGKHTKDSDHYAGRAVDFVVPGMMNAAGTEEVYRRLKEAGVDIRRNARGTEQFFGPGRGANKPGDHNSHFHTAWQGSPDTSKVDAAKTRALEEAKKAYDALVKSAGDYAMAQLEEAATTGMTAKQIREYADAAAIAKAPTDVLKQAIVDAAAVREAALGKQSAAEFDANIMQPLRDEIALQGLTGAARAAAALELEKTGFIAKNMGDGIEVATARWKEYSDAKKLIIEADDAAAREVENVRRMREEFDALLATANAAGDAIAESFGRVGAAVGDAINILVLYQGRERAIGEQAKKEGWSQAKIRKENNQLALEGVTAFTGATKNMFREHSTAYKAMAAAEKAFALVQLANTAVNVAAGAAKMFASLGPFAFPAVAAMIGVMAALGFSKGGGSAKAPETNDGSGTVLGDSTAKSESITRALGQLRDIDTVMLSYSRQMAASLRTIENEIGGFASLLVRNAESINANGGVKAGFNSNAGTVLGILGGGVGALLTKIPVVGDLLKGLFGTKTSIVGSGLYGGAQSIGGILNGGFDASYFSDVQKKKKFFGITTSNKTSTQYTGADPLLENQFTLILRSFNDAILAAAGPLGASTSEIQQKLNSFVVSIGKIDLQGLTGEQIEEKLTAVFGAAADSMASAAFPLITQFQKAGEGAFETLIRVASTLEAVSGSLDMLGQNAQGMSIAMKLGLADQFESVSALTGAVDAYFQSFYTKEEQAAARTAQMASVFQSLGLAMPNTLAGFRALVEAQNLNTVAGQATYATLLKLAPAFADLQAALEGAKSAADIASEKADLQRQLLELNGDTAALRALQLAKLDASNRALQQQIWAIQDAQAAAKAAEELRKAWTSVGDSIFDEIQRIRGLTAAGAGSTFASLQGQFNAATLAARGGDMDAAKSLPQLSQALLAAAADAATSRQELDRIRAQTAAALEATYGLIGRLGGTPGASNAELLNAGATSQPATAAVNDNAATLNATIVDLREETERMRNDLSAALATIAANTGKTAKTLENVTADSGGDAVSTRAAAA